MHVWLSTTGTSIHLSWLKGPSVPKEKKKKAGELTPSVHTTYTAWHILLLLALPSSQKRDYKLLPVFVRFHLVQSKLAVKVYLF